MSLRDDFADGAAIAAMEALRSLITLLILQKTIPKDLIIELLDQALLRLEQMQAVDKTGPEGQWQAARLQLTLLLGQLRQLPAPE